MLVFWSCCNKYHKLDDLNNSNSKGRYPRSNLELLVSLRYLSFNFTACELSNFSRVRLFVTPWTVAARFLCPCHGTLQARILEWVAKHSSRGYSQSRDRTHVSSISCIGKKVLYHWHELGSPLISLWVFYFKQHPVEVTCTEAPLLI